MIDDKLQKKLRERFNPDGSDLRNMQLRMLDMLKYLDKVCQENNIKYWLSSGTCLGAVRHGGFIPWDDDVDIEMLKPDYKRLRKVILQDEQGPLYWQDALNDEHYYYVYGKLRDKFSEVEERHDLSLKYKYKGLFIDVFVMTPSNSFFLRKFCTVIYLKAVRCIKKIESEKIRKYCKFFMIKVFVPIADSIQHIFANGRLRHSSGSYFFRPRRCEDVEDIKYVKFEDTELPVPKNVESYLTRIFDNYNILPNIDIITPPILLIVRYLECNYTNADTNILSKSKNVSLNNKIKKFLYRHNFIKFISALYKLTIPMRIAQLRKKKKIKVLFVVNDITKWKSEELYIQMKENDRFEPVIGLTLRTGQSQGTMNRTKKDAEEYLKHCNYPFIQLSKTLKPAPDIVIYSEPYIGTVPKPQRVYKYLSSLFICINYGFHAVRLPQFYNSIVPVFAWIDCYESQLAIDTAYRFLGEKRRSFKLTGLPMTDILLKPAGKDPWKSQKKRKKRIIWAPHHSLGGFDNESIIYSNFLCMCEKMFEIAEEYREDIQIAFKPHPLLKEKLDTLWGVEKADTYYKRWDLLENGQLSDGVYVDLFKYSDALIHDCSSFMIEYQYMNKPVLFVSKDTESIVKDLTDFAKKAFYLQELTTDFDGVRQFISNVINNIDIKKTERDLFYKEELLPPNNRTACENIISTILAKSK